MHNNSEKALSRFLHHQVQKGEVLDELFYEDHEERGLEPDYLLSGVPSLAQPGQFYDVFRLLYPPADEREEGYERTEYLSTIAKIFVDNSTTDNHSLVPIAYYFDQEKERDYYIYPAIEFARLEDLLQELKATVHIDGEELFPAQRRLMATNFAQQMGTALDALRAEQCAPDDFSEYSVLVTPNGDFFLRVDETYSHAMTDLAEIRWKRHFLSFFELTMRLLVSHDSAAASVLKSLSVELMFQKDDTAEDFVEMHQVLDHFTKELKSILGESSEDIYQEMRQTLTKENLGFLVPHLHYEDLRRFVHFIAFIKEELSSTVSEFIKAELHKAYSNKDAYSFAEFGTQLKLLLAAEGLI